MFGIDVSGNQPDNICRMVEYDFAIVKATGNPKSGNYKWNYKNPYMRRQVEDALNKTGCAGLYHFAYGMDAKTEADFFIDAVKDYIGRAILVLDYETPLSDKNNREWARSFLRRVKERTGVAPILYASASVIKDQRLSELCSEEGCGLWSANYWKGYSRIEGYNVSGLKQTVDSVLWQFTSSGRLKGYSGNLDLDEFHGTKEDWSKYAKGSQTPSQKPSNYDPDIAELQAECNRQGFSNQAVDGIAGKNTLAGCPTIKSGASGNITKWVQKRLIKMGYSLPRYGADSKFGAETVSAVKRFQKDNGLTADGIIGKNTWKKLLGM